MRTDLAAWPLLAILSIPAWSATEYRRPTSDVDANPPSFCSGAPGISSSSEAVVYSGKSGAGPTGSSYSATASGGLEPQVTSRKFVNFQAASTGYTTLVVNISLAASFTGSGTPLVTAYYSTNSGSTWTMIPSAYLTSARSQATYTATIAINTLPTLQVAVCTIADVSTSTATSTTYDIWTAGTSGRRNVVSSWF